MSKVYIGKIVNTHGIKGEIRILSDFDFKDNAFRVGSNIIVDDTTYKINSYRKHKQFDMVTLDGFNDINEVLFLMKKKVYKLKNELNLTSDQILDEDLINFQVIDKDKKSGIIEEIFYASPTNKILRVKFDREVLIPFNSPMIKNIDTNQKIIEVELIEGMM
ncbi:MAG: 16S rRNA processing protein RimM [Bacilli bacterium]|nr:16S rRNA processing protein RimM [Bacilli bacterium]